MNEHLQHGRTRQKLRTRTRILEAAMALLEAEKPVTMEEVAKAAQMSRATIYRYYSNIDVLSAEAALQMNTANLESVFSDYGGSDWSETFLGIQRYYNRLALDYEPLFRKYLSVILDPESGMNKRGARRVDALTMALEEHSANIPDIDRENLIALATLLMGIEAMIVMKDVCGYDDKRSLEVLKFGMELICKGLRTG